MYSIRMLPCFVRLCAFFLLGLVPVWGHGDGKDVNSIDRLLRENGYEVKEVEKSPVRRMVWSEDEKKVLERGRELMLERGGEPDGDVDAPVVQLARTYADFVDGLGRPDGDDPSLESVLVAASAYGLYDVAELLLRKGANPNGYYQTFWGSPDHCMVGDSLLPLAVARDRRMAVLLLAAGADVDGEQTSGPGAQSVFQWRLLAPLRVAVKEGNDELAVFLLDRGAGVLFDGVVEDTTGHGRHIPLFVLACNSCRLSTVKRLLEAGVEYEFEEEIGDALSYAIYGGKADTFAFLLSHNWSSERLAMALHEAASYGRGDMVLLLLEKGMYGKQEVTDAFLELCRYDEAVALRALLERGADVLARRKDGATALIWAASLGYSDCVAVMLEYGADVRAVDRVGKDAWRWAQECGSDPVRAQPGHAEVCALLRRAGGATEDVEPVMPVFSEEELAIMDGVLGEEERRCAAEMAVRRQLSASRGWRDEVRAYMELLRRVRNGDSLDALGSVWRERDGTSGKTLLWFACTFGDVELVKLLLEKGADPNRTGRPGDETALEAAPRNRSAHEYRRVPSPDGKEEIDEPVKDDRAYRAARIVGMLLRHGARGGRAVEFAVAAKNVECVRLLLAAGADLDGSARMSRSRLLYDVVSGQDDPEVRRELADLLLKSEAEKDWQEDEGRNFLDVAKDPEMRRLLEKWGVKQGGVVNGKVAGGE